MDRRRALKAGLALCAVLVAPRARACEFFSNTLRITHPWTRTSGNATAAAIFMRFDEASETDRLVGVETPVAERAQLIGELVIPAGGELVLSEQGPHVRLVELKHPLFVGRVYPLKLTFEKGGVVNANLNVDFLGLLSR